MKRLHPDGLFCEIHIWLHSHFQTNELLEIQLFGVTKIYSGRLDKGWFEFIEQALEDEHKDFEHLEKEAAYLIDVHLGFDLSEPYFTFDNARLDSPIELPNDKTNAATKAP